jgi:hypothetical protein
MDFFCLLFLNWLGALWSFHIFLRKITYKSFFEITLLKEQLNWHMLPLDSKFLALYNFFLFSYWFFFLFFLGEVTPYIYIKLLMRTMHASRYKPLRYLQKTYASTYISNKGHSWSFFICLSSTYLSRWHEYSNPRWLNFIFFPSRIALWLKKFHNNYSICLLFILRPCFFSYNFLIWINYFNLKIIFSSSSFNFFHLSNLIFILIVIWINHKKKDQTWLFFFFFNIYYLIY